MGLLKKIFMSSDEKCVRELLKQADIIDAFEPQMQALSDEELRDKTQEFKQRLTDGETLDDILCEAFAAFREAAFRTISERPFREQLIGAMVLHQGRIAELKTGEGKTLMSTLVGYLNALTGEGVHLVTVNDYLARHQSAWMGKIYTFMGLSVGVIYAQMEPALKRAAYAADITYGTNNEFGFDYLRDNMVIHKHNMVQRPLVYAMVDEVDSILIDEARTPLIISGAGEKSTELYARAHTFVRRLKEKPPIPDDIEVDENDPKYSGDYIKDEKMHTVNLSDEGVEKTESYFGVENLGDIENSELSHHINQALKANALMHNNKDYIVKDGEVVIVDEFTGRLMVGRRYSDGLHQAIEAKENVSIRNESKTLATITFQNYFRMYKKLSGMTATAKTEENEFRGIYNMDVVIIPTHKPMIRIDENDTIYRSKKSKFDAVVDDVYECNQRKQPVLVGTVSVETSEHLSKLLKQRGLKHTVLNAKLHEKEAEIVAQAGKIGNITIATNMAGRGTDIKLGGDPTMMARKDLIKEEVEIDKLELAVSHISTDDQEILELRKRYYDILSKYKVVTDKSHDEVVALGGLKIIGTERHESRRIDNQLRGRSGRQGDPGSSKFYIALEDDLMRLFGGEKMNSLMSTLNVADDVPLEYGMLSKQIENAQKKVEGRNFTTRKHVLQYDDVMNKQRELIYAQRRRVLEGESIHDSLQDMLKSLVYDAIMTYSGVSSHPEEWDINGLLDYFHHIFLPNGYITFTQDEVYELTIESLKDKIFIAAIELYDAKEKSITENGLDMREFERVILLRVVDRKWMDHIDAMDRLRQGVGLRAYGQRDPVVEYRMEGFDMFEAMTQSIREEALSMIFKASVKKPIKRKAAQSVMEGRQRQAGTKVKKPGTNKKIGRNDPCPCQSGKKYKQCCGK